VTKDEDERKDTIGQKVEDKPHLTEFWVDIQGPSDLLYRIWINRTFRKLVPGSILFLVLLFMPTPNGLTIEGQRTIALFAFIVYLWVTETFPLPVTAFMAGVGLLVLGIYTGPDRATKAFAPYGADAVFMVLGSLIMAQGLISSGASRVIASYLIRNFASSTWKLLIGIILISSMISAVIPGHSVAAFQRGRLHAARGLLHHHGHRHEEQPGRDGGDDNRHRHGLRGGLPGDPLGGCPQRHRHRLPPGTSRVRGADHVHGLGDLGPTHHPHPHPDHLRDPDLALPITLILIPITFVILTMVFKVRNRPLEVTPLERPEGQGYRPYLGLGILIATIIMFVTLSDRLSLGAVAMIGGILMFVFGLLRWDAARGEIRWGVIFIYGAALTMGKAMADEEVGGAANWIADGLLGGLGTVTIIALVMVVILIAAIFTNLMSDAAAVALLLPIVVPMAIMLGAGGNEAEYAFVMTMATAIAAGYAYITVFGTPPNTIVHASGFVTSRDFLKGGLALWLASVAVMLIVVNTYWKVIL